MQSKIVINILALVALAGLVTFSVFAIVDFENSELDNKRTVGENKAVFENKKVVAQTKDLQANFIQLTKKNEMLQKALTDSRSTQATLGEVLLDLENKKALVVTELEGLEIKRVKLNNTLLELRRDLETEKNLKAQNIQAQNESINNYKKIISELAKLEEKNKTLAKEMIILKNNHRQSLLGLNSKLTESEGKFDQKENEFRVKEEVFKKKITDLSERLKNLTIESQNSYQQLVDQKETYLRQLEQKKAELAVLIDRNTEIQNLKSLKSNFEKLDGLRVIFSGNMIYDEAKSQIVFKAENSIGIPIFQDDFTGSIAGKCGLPIDRKISNRCSATIIAEFVVENQGLFLRGKEIVDIVRK